jgi:hypothetical protein
MSPVGRLFTARRRMESISLTALADEFHNGMLRWFECVIAEGSAAEEKIILLPSNRDESVNSRK